MKVKKRFYGNDQKKEVIITNELNIENQKENEVWVVKMPMSINSTVGSGGIDLFEY